MLVTATPAHLVSLARSILMPAKKSLLLVLLPRLDLGEVLSLPINDVLAARVDTHLVSWPALTID